MKFCGKIIVFLLTIFSLHHFCEWNQCSSELEQVCYYTSPSTWNGVLLKRSTIYSQQIAPKVALVSAQYSTLVEPYVKKGSQLLNEAVTKPIVTIVSKALDNIEAQPYVKFIHDQIVFVLEKIVTYYNIFLEPYVTKIEQQLGFKKQYTSVQDKLSPYVLPYCEIATPYVRCAKTKFQELKSRYLNYIKDSEDSIKAKKERLEKTIKEKKEETKESIKKRKALYDAAKTAKKVASSEKPSETTSVAKGKTTPVLDKEVYADLYKFKEDAENMSDEDSENDDDDDNYEENYTSTSTITKIVTLGNGEIKTAINRDIIADEQNAVQIDFDNWSDAIERKMESILELFDKEVNKTAENILKIRNTSLKKLLREISSDSQDSYQEISKKIEDIDCITEVDPKTGQKIHFDKTGTTQIPAYVDRQLMRDLFEKAKLGSLTISSQISNDIAKIDTDFYFSVEGLRQEYAELYEEWANVMVNEWSKRLAYVDVVDAHVGSDNDKPVSEENWKKFLSIKKKIISKRDEFATHPVSMDELILFTKKVHNTLIMIERENSEYLYILRSKANLAFQKREKEEADREAQEVQENEKN